MTILPVVINGHNLGLGNRFIWQDGDLLLADLHLGKTTHFRKAGLPIPSNARKADQTSFFDILTTLEPTRVIILGDLFHSEHNSEVDEISMITSQFPCTNFILVKGNHDVMPEAVYRSLDISTTDVLHWNGFILSHEPLVEFDETLINMHGHIHPGVLLSGKGRQHEKIPCFHLSARHFCLPAYGALTGLMKIHPKKGDQVFGVAESSVVKLL